MDPIKTESQYQQALLDRKGMLEKNDLDERYEKISEAILNYELARYPLPPLDPVKVIQARMAHLGLERKDLIGLVASKTTVGDALLRGRSLSPWLQLSFATALDLDPGLLALKPVTQPTPQPQSPLHKRPTPKHQNIAPEGSPPPTDPRWRGLVPPGSKNPDAVALISETINRKGLSRAKMVADKLLDSGALSELLNKRRPISKNIMLRFSRYLNIPIEQLDTQYPPLRPLDPGNLQSRLKIVALISDKLKEKGLKRLSLRPVFGSHQILEDFFTGHLRLTDSLIDKLARHFNLNPDRLREKD